MEKETENDQEITQQGSEKNSAVDVEEHESKATDCSPTFDFTETSWRTGDFILNVEGTKLHVAKNILALASPVFDRMFQSEFKEKEKEELDLPGKKLEDVVEFLRCIYPNFFVPIDRENALRLLPLFDEYQVFHLKERCEHALVENVTEETSAEELFQRLQDADMYNLKELRTKCITLSVQKPTEKLVDAKKSCKPPAEDLAEIFENIALGCHVKKEKLPGKTKIELSIDGPALEKKIKELEASNERMSDELIVWNKYVASEVKANTDLLFPVSVKWKELHVAISAQVNENYKSSIQSDVWDIPLKITTSVIKEREYLYRRDRDIEWLSVTICSTGTQDFTCDLNVRYDLVIMQPNGQTFSVIDKEKFKSVWLNGSKTNIKRINEINDLDAGFLRDGKIGILVHLYMSEPNKKN